MKIRQVGNAVVHVGNRLTDGRVKATRVVPKVMSNNFL